ncbi:hypothetical protein ACSNOB_04830 [Micromonospora sp. URMC 106]|uniref:hypothetical protein n=1 Tax=Micromonospora sp. URMC 106 TaxID=3423408 RepID=UPI003F1A0FA2
MLDDEDRTPRAASSEPGTDVTPTPLASEPGDNAVTARSTNDFGNVCEGRQILNAAAYSGATGAKAYVFANSPDRPAFWSSTSIASSRPYYAENMESVSVVGCLEFVGGGEGTPLECKYTGVGQRITIDYTASRYKLTFYAAKTAEKIGDGGTVSTPAKRCPTFLSSYNKNTMTAYASPDTAVIAAAMEKFLS